MLGRLKPQKGKIECGEVKIGYFDQHREMLDDSKDLLETFCPFGGDRIDVKGKICMSLAILKTSFFLKNS